MVNPGETLKTPQIAALTYVAVALLTAANFAPAIRQTVPHTACF